MTKTLAAAGALIVLAGCNYSPAPDRVAYTAGKVAKEIEGRTAQPTQRCLSRVHRDSVRGVGDAIFFGNGRTIYKMETNGICSGLERGPQAILVTETFGSGDLCRGDQARVVDSYSKVPLSTCMVEGFTPYTKG